VKNPLTATTGRWPRPPRTLGLCLALAAFGALVPAIAQPTNDNFAHRASLSGARVTVASSLAAASFEPGEPFIPEVSSGQTAWWSWTAPANGIVTLSVGPTNPSPPLLAVYAGSDLAGLSLVASNNYASCYEWCGGTSTCHWRVREQTTFHVVRGEVCQIAVDSAVTTRAQEVWGPGSVSVIWTTNIVDGGDYSLGLRFTAAPKNDDFAHPISLRRERTQLLASNAGATRQPGEPNHLDNPGGSSVWYAWAAPASGRVTLSAKEMPVYAPPSSYGAFTWSIDIIAIGPPACTTESPQTPLPTFFPLFAAYTGSSVDALTPAGWLPLSLPGYDNAVCFDVVKGYTYHIAFDGNMGTTGSTPLCLALTKPAMNDGFAHRLALHGIYVTATGYNAGATSQPGEPAIGGTSAGKTVWWSWTAPVSGTVSIDLTGSDYAFPVAIFTGSSLAGLSQVAAGSGAVSFEAVAGRTYQIAVSDCAGLTGAINLLLQAPVLSLDLSGSVTSFRSQALLTYTAIAGQKVLLERSSDGSNWQTMQTLVTHRNSISFLVRSAPTDSGPFYRALVIDRAFP
jgi:hypothetical protein